MPHSRGATAASGPVTLVAIVGVVAVLYAAQAVLIPIALAILLSFLLAPLIIRLQRLGLGRVPSVVLVTVVSFLLTGLLSWVVAGQVIELASQLPQYQDNIRAKIDGLQQRASSVFGRASRGIREITKEVAESASRPEAATTHAETPARPLVTAPTTTASTATPIPVVITEKPANPIQSVIGALTPMIGPLASAGIVIVFVIFMLIQREDLRDRVIRLIGQGRLTVTTQALDDAATRVSRYLLMLLLVNTAYGAAVALGLYVIGVPNALLWGVLSALLRFIPYIGPWIAASMPILLSLAVFNNWSRTLETAALFIVIELVSNNLMEPWLYSANTGISPMAVLVAAVFWAWLWGPIGLVMAVPLTVCVVVLGRYVPRLEFLDVLLGDQPSLPTDARIYQRLLAMDQDEVYELATNDLKTRSLAEFYDVVLIPALGMAERDRHHGVLDAARERHIYQSIRDLIENLGERHKQEALATAKAEVAAVNGHQPQATASQAGETPPNPDAPPRKCILCLPARNEADEIAALMLAQLLESEGACAKVISAETLAAEIVDEVEQQNADAVCISAMPPLAVMHSRYLCKRLAMRFPDLNVVVGLWHVANIERAKERIRTCGTERVASTLMQAVEQFRA